MLLLIAFLVLQWRTQDREPLVPFALFRDRNYAVVNLVSGTLAFGMMGIFLPFTIYLQSVLGFSALQAGVTMAPASRCRWSWRRWPGGSPTRSAASTS